MERPISSTVWQSRLEPIHYQPTVTPPKTISKKLDRLAFNRDGIMSLELQREALVNAALDQISSVLNSNLLLGVSI